MPNVQFGPLVLNSTYETYELDFYLDLKEEWMTSHNMTESEFQKDEDLQGFLHMKAQKQADSQIEYDEKVAEEQKRYEEE